MSDFIDKFRKTAAGFDMNTIAANAGRMAKGFDPNMLTMGGLALGGMRAMTDREDRHDPIGILGDVGTYGALGFGAKKLFEGLTADPNTPAAPPPGQETAKAKDQQASSEQTAAGANDAAKTQSAPKPAPKQQQPPAKPPLAGPDIKATFDPMTAVGAHTPQQVKAMYADFSAGNAFDPNKYHPVFGKQLWDAMAADPNRFAGAFPSATPPPGGKPAGQQPPAKPAAKQAPDLGDNLIISEAGKSKYQGAGTAQKAMAGAEHVMESAAERVKVKTPSGKYLKASVNMTAFLDEMGLDPTDILQEQITKKAFVDEIYAMGQTKEAGIMDWLAKQKADFMKGIDMAKKTMADNPNATRVLFPEILAKDAYDAYAKNKEKVHAYIKNQYGAAKDSVKSFGSEMAGHIGDAAKITGSGLAEAGKAVGEGVMENVKNFGSELGGHMTDAVNIIKGKVQKPEAPDAGAAAQIKHRLRKFI